nr:hypothetical protein [Segniliparus rugosus]
METPTPSRRGVTVVHARARQRLIERAALSVPGVVVRRGALPGQSLPSVSTEVREGRSIVDVRIAASWPADSGQITDEVRRAVAKELHRSLGERPDHVRVQIARFESERTPAQVAQACAAGHAEADDTGANRSGAGPRGLASATVVALLIALALIVAGVCALRDAAIGFGWLHGSTLVQPAASWIDGGHWSWWTWPFAAAAAITGLALVVLAVAPRPRTHVLVGDGVWLPRTALGHWQDQQRGGFEDGVLDERIDR